MKLSEPDTKTLIETMNVIHTDIKDVVIIEPRVFKDARGLFFRKLFKKRIR